MQEGEGRGRALAPASGRRQRQGWGLGAPRVEGPSGGESGSRRVPFLFHTRRLNWSS